MLIVFVFDYVVFITIWMCGFSYFFAAQGWLVCALCVVFPLVFLVLFNMFWDVIYLRFTW